MLLGHYAFFLSLSTKIPEMATASETETNKHIILRKQQVVPKWYAIYTCPRAEKQVHTRLLEESVESFLPLQKTYRQWSDRKKLIEKPLLSSYVFVRVVPKEFSKVYTTNGVVKFVSFEGKPVAIPQKQIDNLKLLVNSDATIEVTTEKFEKGDNVEVMMGSLVGLTGELIKIGKQKRVVVRIDKLEQNIIVTIPVTFLRKV
jgi:transcriptional antiterminator RfaH